MTEYNGMIRNNVIKGDGEFTSEFLEFMDRCQGEVKIKNKENDKHSLLSDEIIFEYEEDLVLYQLTFEEIDRLTLALSIIRNIMPSVIANEIIGVQPMIGVGSHIFTLKNIDKI